MLVLKRKIGESIRVGPPGREGEIKITVIGMTDGTMRIGVYAPLEYQIDREEIYREKQHGNHASQSDAG